jgi:hypothetical protein
MAKSDFCFTYYDGDAARDMAHMNRLERGAYTDIMISQRKFGHLTLDQIKKILGKDFEECFPAVELVLQVDNDGKFFIEWVDTSTNKREAYIASRTRNKAGLKKGDSFLYLLKDSITGYVKIGISQDPEIRIHEVIKYTKEPLLEKRDVKLIFQSGVVPVKEERALHKKFNKKRVLGEWFSLCDEDIEIICKSYDTHMVNGNGYVNEKDRVGGSGEETQPHELSDSGFWLDELPKDLQLTPTEIQLTIEFISHVNSQDISPQEVIKFWEAFKINNFSKREWKNSHSHLISHFRDSLKYQIKNLQSNGKSKQNHPHKPVITGAAESAGTL